MWQKNREKCVTTLQYRILIIKLIIATSTVYVWSSSHVRLLRKILLCLNMVRNFLTYELYNLNLAKNRTSELLNIIYSVSIK
jgi:hypothetical protein